MFLGILVLSLLSLLALNATFLAPAPVAAQIGVIDATQGKPLPRFHDYTGCILADPVQEVHEHAEIPEPLNGLYFRV